MGRGKPSSLKTEIYDSILKDIIEGNYKQNEIINEKQLIEKYGVFYDRKSMKQIGRAHV